VVADVDYIAASDYADKKDRLDLYIPANVTKAPVIFSIHGGGLRQGTSRGRRLSDSALRRPAT
jgi:acetyl esterase/lipase